MNVFLFTNIGLYLCNLGYSFSVALRVVGRERETALNVYGALVALDDFSKRPMQKDGRSKR